MTKQFALPLLKFILFPTGMLALAIAAGAQTYKIGDKHPDGGIVASVDESGTKVLIVDEKDTGPLTPAEAFEAAKRKGNGWRVPNVREGESLKQNVHNKGLGNFKPEFYLFGRPGEIVEGTQMSDFSRPGGFSYTGPVALNDRRLVRFVRTISSGTSSTNSKASAQPSYNVRVKGVDQGDWVIGNRPGKLPIEVNISSTTQGKTAGGQVKYEKKEGMLGLRMSRKDGNTYTAETKLGDKDWTKEGDWTLGGRNDKAVIKLQAKSTDGGKTLTGTVTYSGEDPVEFKAEVKQ